MLVVALLVSSFVIFISLDLAPGDPLSTLTGGRTPVAGGAGGAAPRSTTSTTRCCTATGTTSPGSSCTATSERSIAVPRAGLDADLPADRGHRGAGPVLRRARSSCSGSGWACWPGCGAASRTARSSPSRRCSRRFRRSSRRSCCCRCSRSSSAGCPPLGNGSGFGGTIEHLTLPAIALAASAFAVVVRVTRVTVRSELGQEHVQTATSRGIPWRAGRPPPRAAQRLDPDHHRGRHHHHVAVRALAPWSSRRSTSTGSAPRSCRPPCPRTSPSCRASRWCSSRAFVIANALVDLLYAVLDPRVAIGSRAA